MLPVCLCVCVCVKPVNVDIYWNTHVSTILNPKKSACLFWKLFLRAVYLHCFLPAFSAYLHPQTDTHIHTHAHAHTHAHTRTHTLSTLKRICSPKKVGICKATDRFKCQLSWCTVATLSYKVVSCGHLRETNTCSFTPSATWTLYGPTVAMNVTVHHLSTWRV